MSTTIRRPRSSQRGAAALFVTVLLCLLMVLATAVAQRNVLVEEQRSANDLRSSLAFEAADAGLEWALARINDPTPSATTCLPSADPMAPSFRARMLRIDPAGVVTPVAWDDAGTPRPLQAACVRGTGGWTCSCPTDRRPLLPAVDGGALAPAFFVELAPSAATGVVRVVATGCTAAGGDAGGCAAPTAGGREATRRLEAAWALLPALRSPPAAALTLGGDLDVGAAAFGVHNADADSAGLAVHAGGRIVASALRIGAPPGAPLGASLVAGDDALHGLAAERLFARHFGMGRSAWSAQPAARRVACADDCTSAVAAVVAAGARLLVLDGDAALAGPIALGSPEDPLVVVASGTLRLSGDVAIYGVVAAAGLEWNDAAAGGAFVRGALLIDGDVRGNASADVIRDRSVLELLARRDGSFVRVNGSWKDF
jgi:hypothetical protein